MDTTTETVQDKMRKKLESFPIPSKEIKVYGSQIMITCKSEAAAKKWYVVLNGLKPASLRIGPSMDYNKKNMGTNLCPSVNKVWRVWASL